MRLKLRELMEQRQVNQVQLAEGLGTTKATVNSWLVGQMKAGKRITVLPSGQMMDALCAFFEVGPGDLLEVEAIATPTGRTWRNVTPSSRRRAAEGEAT